MKFTITTVTSMIGGILMSGMALAANGAQSTTVKFQDLNLTSNAGVATLYQRIHSAAASVCKGTEDSHQLKPMAEQRKCIQSAEDGAVRRVNVSALAAYYESKTGRAVASMAANNTP